MHLCEGIINIPDQRDAQVQDITPLHKGEVIDELYRAGIEMKRCQLQRAHPGLSSVEIEVLLRAWLFKPPQGVDGWGTITVYHNDLADLNSLKSATQDE